MEAAQQIAHFGWWERDFITNHVSLSDEVRRIFGVQPVELPAWHGRWLDLIHPDDRTRVAEAAAAALLPGGPRYDVEYRVVQPDGAVRAVHSQGDVTWDDSGRPLRQFGVLQDVTELRQAEQELRASEARFRTFVDHATDAFFLLDDQSTVLDVNRQACQSLGYSRDELIGKHRSDLDAGLDDAALESLRQRVVFGEPVTFETRHKRKDGTSFPVEVRVRQFDQGGRRFLCLVRDITEHKRAENELRASETRFRTFVDYAIDGFFLLDINSIVLDVNRQGCENLGYSREELIGQHRSLFDPDLDQGSIAQLAQHRFTGETVTFESHHRRKDGTSFPVEVRVRAFEQGGRRFLALVRDLTERKQVEDELRASETRFRILVDHASDAFFLYNEDGTVLDVNRQACESLGYSRDELIGMTAFDYGPDLTPELLQRIRDRLQSGKIVSYDGRHRRKDGTVFPVEVRIRAHWHAGKMLAVSLDRDITERKRAEDELRASEERFRTLVQFSFDVYWETDAEHRFIQQQFAEGQPDATAWAPKSARPAGKCPTSSLMTTAWRKHREILDAHLPFRDFELARPTADGGKRSMPPCPGCRCSTRRDASSATVASGGTSPSARRRKRRCAAVKLISLRHRG